MLTRMLQRVLHGYWRVSRGLTLGVRAAVLDDAGRVLLIRHTYAPGWHLPGGGVEAGETVLEALRRELLEEARIEMTGEARLSGIFFNRSLSRRDHVLVYVVRAFRVIGPRAPDWEIAEARFFPVADLPEGTTRATRARLDEILSGRTLSANW